MRQQFVTEMLIVAFCSNKRQHLHFPHLQLPDGLLPLLQLLDVVLLLQQHLGLALALGEGLPATAAVALLNVDQVAAGAARAGEG